MFELTPSLLPTFRAWLLSTRSLCFNGRRRNNLVMACFKVIILKNRIKNILSLRCCKFKRKGRYNFAFFRLDKCERWQQLLCVCVEIVINCPCLFPAIQLYWNFKLYCFLFLFFFQNLRFQIGAAAYLRMRLIHGCLR